MAEENIQRSPHVHEKFCQQIWILQGNLGKLVCLQLELFFFADRNVSSSAELESGNAPGAFLQTSAPVLDKISGPMGAQFLSSTGLQFATLIERAQLLPAPALDKNRPPIFCLQLSFFAYSLLSCLLEALCCHCRQRSSNCKQRCSNCK